MGNELDKYLEASLYGAGRGLIALPVEHPLDMVKTRSQAFPEQKSWEITKKIFQNKGFLGFYTGAIPNGIRLAVKQMYRYPMMLSLPRFFEGILPSSFHKKYQDIIPFATAVTIATLESFIICPLERGKVFLMTYNKQSINISGFFTMYKGKIRKELFRGVGAVYTRQISTWASFLVSDKRVKNWEKRRTNTEELSFTSLMKVSFIVGCINTAFNMPFDVAKTSLQKQEHFSNKHCWNALKTTYIHHGMPGLYAGWKPRMIQYMLQSAFTVTLLERLERSWKK